MDRWRGRVAVVTGASAGIGAAVVRALLQHGLVVVGVARRADRIQAIAKSGSYPGKLHAVQADLSKEQDIEQAFRWVKDNLGRVDILVNNAGVFNDSQITEGSSADFRRMLEVNVLGLTLCTQRAVRLMRDTGVDDGHIVNIGSVAGHWMPVISEGAFYFGTKHAVRVLSEGLRREFVQRKSNMRVTEISPGLVATDIFDELKLFSREAILKQPHIQPEDIADAVVYVLGAPPSVLVHEMMVMPVQQKMLNDN